MVVAVVIGEQLLSRNLFEETCPRIVRKSSAMSTFSNDHGAASRSLGPHRRNASRAPMQVSPRTQCVGQIEVWRRAYRTNARLKIKSPARIKHTALQLNPKPMVEAAHSATPQAKDPPARPPHQVRGGNAKTPGKGREPAMQQGRNAWESREGGRCRVREQDKRVGMAAHGAGAPCANTTTAASANGIPA
jgi:hypothetical protein